MRPILTALAAAVLATSLLLACGDDDPTGPHKPRPDSTFFVPFPTSLGEALDQAQPGDTLEIVSMLSLTELVTVPSAVTPLVIRGDLSKERPTVSGAPGGALVFESPLAGTRLEHLAFEGLNYPVTVQGSGVMDVEDCDFQDGLIHVKTSSTGNLAVRVTDCLMIDPAGFGIDSGGPGRVTATGNTIVGAGDCGVRLGGGVEFEASHNLISASTNYGIACTSGSSLTASGCNDIFDSGITHYLSCTPPATDFHLDPLFCPADSAAWFLQEVSPCAPLNSGTACGNQLIGARGVGCYPQL